MGEMTIRLDDAVLVQLRQRAERLGTDVEQLAADLLRDGLAGAQDDRAAIARVIQARSVPSPMSSVAMLDQIRNEGR
jgi:plasmid stability protein